MGLWGELLTSPNYAERGWVDPDAAVWFMEHPYPWSWRVYDHISRFLHDPKLRKYRIEAVRFLGECGPTSILDPLPHEVEGLQKFLGRLSKESEDQALRKEAAAALARNRARGEEAVWETRISICAIASEPSAPLLPGERIARFVEPARLPIHPPLTILPSPGETSFVARMDASQEVSPDLDLSSYRFTTNGGGDGFSPGRSAAATAVHADRLDLGTVTFTTTDPEVQHTRMALVSVADKGSMVADAVRVTIQEMDDDLGPVRPMIVRKLRSLLDLMQHLGSLSSFEENSVLVDKIKEYATVSQADLVFTDSKKGLKNEPVAIECLNAEDLKAGRFRLRTYATPAAKIVYARTSFPPLSLAPSSSYSAPFVDEASSSFFTTDAVQQPRTLLAGAAGGNKDSMAADAVRVTIQEMDDDLSSVRMMLVPKLRSLLDLMPHLGSFSSFEENSVLVRKINEYATISQEALVFTDPEKGLKNEPVALECLKPEVRKAGRFRLRTHTTPAKTVYARMSFPPLSLAPSSSHSAPIADNASSS